MIHMKHQDQRLIIIHIPRHPTLLFCRIHHQHQITHYTIAIITPIPLVNAEEKATAAAISI
jgi:hypothetical protein